MANNNEHSPYGDFCNKHPIVGGTCFTAGATMMLMAITEIGKAAFDAVSAWIKSKKNKD